ncbi:hypothetical protein PR048_005965 [Dryococelus australis]|uniref:Reverse transcriptase Ty1/copia-type domain-containing protein n=1 Tax=Dryococelus australis TaxID=614101 RepID=A0ABQ9I9Q5_9NEOP|nr:hypothetical protein PR048_005965 [Dryococelus australis]
MDVPTAFVNGELEGEVYIVKPEGVGGKKRILKLQHCVWLVLWVDDILLLRQKSKVEELAELLKGEFNAKDMENTQCFAGTEIKLVDRKIELSHRQLIEKMLKMFNLQECTACLTTMEDRIEVNDADVVIVVPYRELVGSLTYLSQISRPDITSATSYLSHFSGLSNAPLVECSQKSAPLHEGHY